MKTATEWLTEYAESHQNEKNVLIHTICVPAIYFSIVGMLMTVNIIQPLNAYIFILTNLAFIISFLILMFYATLSFKIFLRMLIFTIFCLVVNLALLSYVNLFLVNLTVFVLAWIGQFYGHKIEGKKPSFFKDVQFLLIGPVWVFEKLLK